MSLVSLVLFCGIRHTDHAQRPVVTPFAASFPPPRLKIAEQKQKVAIKEAETEKRRAEVEAEKAAQVSCDMCWWL